MTIAGRYEEPLDRSSGQSIPNLAVTVYGRGLAHTVGNKSALFSDLALTTPLANPLPTGVAAHQPGIDVLGNMTFYAAAGDLYEAAATGFTTWLINVPPDGTAVAADAAALAQEITDRQSADTLLGLVPTAVKTSNYSAAAQDLVPVDTTSGAVTVTLPSAPADKTRIAVKHVIQGGTNAVTIARGGSDVFNKAGGSTSLTLTLLNQGAVLQYKATGGIWYVVSTDIPLSGLDARFASLTGTNTFTGVENLTGGTTAAPNMVSAPIWFGPAARDGSSLLVKDNSSPTGVGIIEWLFDYTAADEGIHLTTGPNFTGSGGSGPIVLAIGNNYGGVGLFINNYTTGVGLKITQRATISNSAAWGLLVSQDSTTAEAAYFSLGVNGGTVAAFVNNFVGSTSPTKLVTWWRSKASVKDKLSGYVAFDGTFSWQDKAVFLPDLISEIPMTVTGLSGQTADLQQWTVSGSGVLAFMDKGGNLTATTVNASAAGAFLQFTDSGGTANTRRFKIKQSSGSFLVLALNDAGSTNATLLQIAQDGTQTIADGGNFVVGTGTGTKWGTAANQKQAWWGAARIVQPTTAVAGATFVANSSGIVNDTATYDGYSIGQLVRAIRLCGFLA